MIFKPAILSLLAGSTLTAALLLYGAYYAVVIVGKWDLGSGSEFQLDLENRTYLISTAVTFAFAFQIASLFLFVRTADRLHDLFVGAMCAAGTLNVNGWGYPVLLLKTANFLLAGLWLVVNHADNRGYDYPLIKAKYILLLGILPLLLAETAMQAVYFAGLEPDILTSCCGRQFSADALDIGPDAGFPAPGWFTPFYFYAMAGTLGIGTVFYLRGKWGYAYSIAALAMLFLSMAAIISFISVYIYELPTHHCPFCILQAEYGYIGYPMFATIMGGALFGTGVGVLTPFRKVKSLREILPPMQRKLALLSLIAYACFTAVAAYRMIFSNLRM